MVGWRGVPVTAEFWKRGQIPSSCGAIVLYWLRIVLVWGGYSIVIVLSLACRGHVEVAGRDCVELDPYLQAKL